MNDSALLQGLPFYADLSREEQEAALASLIRRRYPEGELIHSRESECLGLIYVIRGEIRAMMLSEEGREITLYRLTAGETDVLSASCVLSKITFETQMVAEAETELLILPAHFLSRVKDQHWALRQYMYEKLSERFSDVMHTMEALLFTRMDTRIARFLLSQKTMDILTTHEAIAKAVNTSREVASRTLKTLEKEGWIRLQRGRIRILDPQALSRL